MFFPLEPRVLLSAMTITGTSGNDKISIIQTNTSLTAATIQVSNSGATSITVFTGTTTVVLRASKITFSNISAISLVDLGSGDDSFAANKSVAIPITVAGG